MTLGDIKTMLSGITGYASKVAYRSFPVGDVPQLPFICFIDTGSNNFSADNMVFQPTMKIDIELYTKDKSPGQEALVETKLNDNSIYWEKTTEYLEDEKCFEIIYEIEV